MAGTGTIVEVTGRPAEKVRADGWLVLVPRGGRPPRELPRELASPLAEEMDCRDFGGEAGKTVALPVGRGRGRQVLVAAGLGPAEQVDGEVLRLAAAAGARAARSLAARRLAIVPGEVGDDPASTARAVASASSKLFR